LVKKIGKQKQLIVKLSISYIFIKDLLYKKLANKNIFSKHEEFEEEPLPGLIFTRDFRQLWCR
jgi:arginine deiminase